MSRYRLPSESHNHCICPYNKHQDNFGEDDTIFSWDCLSDYVCLSVDLSVLVYPSFFSWTLLQCLHSRLIENYSLICSALLVSIPFYSTPLYSALPYHILLYSTLLYSTLFYSTLFDSTPLHSTLPYPTPLHSTQLYSILLYSTLLHSTLL